MSRTQRLTELFETPSRAAITLRARPWSSRRCRASSRSSGFTNTCSRAPRTDRRSGVRRKGWLGIRSTSSGQPAGGSPVRGDARVPGSEAPVRRREAGCEAGWINWPVRSIKRSLRRRKRSPLLMAVKEEPSPREQGEGHGTHLGAWSGCGGTSRRMGRGTVRRLFWELGRPSSASSLRGARAASAYKRRRREVAGGREGVGGGRSSADGRDNTTRPERRAPASPAHRGGREGR
jgi:hypothetical protein